VGLCSNYIVNKQQDNLWHIYLAGPEGSPYNGGTFVIELKLDNFPFKPPVVTVLTKIYHPNIDEKGLVCEDMIETGAKWAPTKKIVSVMEKIKSMMVAPSTENGLNPDSLKEFQQNHAQWYKTAQNYTQQHAK
jgi:ubiquitin-protein ligase